MSKLWVIGQKKDMNAGHGSSAEVFILAAPNAYSANTLYPAFGNEKLAKAFLKGIDEFGFYQAIPLELKWE
jgi:hypothetical protein